MGFNSGFKGLTYYFQPGQNFCQGEGGFNFEDPKISVNDSGSKTVHTPFGLCCHNVP